MYCTGFVYFGKLKADFVTTYKSQNNFKYFHYLTTVSVAGKK